MKTVIVLAIGFWIGRQIYVNFDKEETKRKEAKVRQRLAQFFQQQGFSKSESLLKAQQLLKT
ncbi:hypothetical protein [Flavilitoribacter nigricans]|uniref:Uncharacterized protein n=1 Tax=Flavilitoribacter nigricans (strain ATCC 23147 / DSM 23189 / NBRC 102662 / NCIMB 1420 / SS-2) TaxID=1122177 RepID=A0A2D0MYC1_FLAN2|nr:hypothetical protein [Flavilitoribacter nigricans]PHN01126.1 hypothetical protein CRP01_38635 [Flavilitoribacter nigricans DSM 23189 = NBRC 102662]